MMVNSPEDLPIIGFLAAMSTLLNWRKLTIVAYQGGQREK